MVNVGTLVLVVMWGIAIGCIYILLATGLNIIFGVMKLVNFAHGELLMIGAYIGFSASVYLGLNAYIGVILSMVIVAPLGILVERVCFRKVLGTDKLNEIFISLGLIYIFDHIAVLLWGDKPKKIVSPFEYFTIPVGQMSIGYDWLISVFIVIALLLGLLFLINRTKFGRAMRATSQNLQATMLMGINVERIYMLSYGLGAALAGAAGALYGIIFSFDPYVGSMPTIKAFAIIILGGLGSIPGAVIGGLLYGIAEQTAALIFGGIWRNAVAFAVLIIVLVLRPTGIFGEEGE